MAGFGHPPLLALLWHTRLKRVSRRARHSLARAHAARIGRSPRAATPATHATSAVRVFAFARVSSRARAATPRSPPRVRREMKTRAPALRRAAQKPLPQAPAPAVKPAPRRAATMRKKTKAEACRMKAADRRRVIHGRSKTLMRHCRIGHRRGSFKDKSYRDRVHAVLESVYGPTFEEGAWWYRNPDEDAFFARVFSMASGVDVTATQAARVFVKNGETRKIELDETAMRDAGVSIEKVAALYEKTPAAAWIAETRGERAPREAIVVPPLVFGEEADEVNVNAPSPHPGSARRASASRATESSASGASESAFRAGSAPEELRERRASALAGAAPPEASDEDDDDATVVADEFNDDVDAFLDEAEDALPALPAGDAETRNENGDALFFGKENLDDVGLSAGIGVLPDSLGLGDLFASQPTTADAEALLLKEDASEKSSMPAARRETCAAARDGFGADTFPFRENGHVYESLDAAPFERLLTLGAVRKNMSFLGATAASAVSARARSELETHLAHVDRILRDSAPHDFSELFCSQ